jgi:hypothetical protein
MIEQFFRRHVPIGAHLLAIAVFDFPIDLAGARFGGFERDQPYRFVLLQITKRSSDLAEIPELQRALSEAATGDNGDGIGGAPIDLNPGYEAFAVFARRVFYTKKFHPSHRHTQAEDLAGANMSMG